MVFQYVMFPELTPEGLTTGTPFTTKEAITDIKTKDRLESMIKYIKILKPLESTAALESWRLTGAITEEEYDYLKFGGGEGKFYNFIMILENLLTFDIVGLPSIFRFMFIVPIWIMISYLIISLIPGVG